MNSFGRIFCVRIFGESHGNGLGVVIDGVPAGIPIVNSDFEEDLSRRRSGAIGTTSRKETDKPELLSGVFEGQTSGSPLTILFRNENIRSGDYENLHDIPRPGHADFVASNKFKGYADLRGGGHFSGRITLGIVAAGVIAKKIINPIQLTSKILEIGGQKDYQKLIEEVTEKGDSLGGLIECTVGNVPIGLGEPFFDSIESVISHIIFSIPAIKGLEFGSGFAAAKMRGSAHNDSFISTEGKTKSNNAGGLNGGITNGNNIIFRVAVKPTSSISLPQETIDMKTGKMTLLEIRGRHDACIALRIPVIIEAATAIALADLIMIDKTR
jgi:chorismate synthase